MCWKVVITGHAYGIGTTWVEAIELRTAIQDTYPEMKEQSHKSQESQIAHTNPLLEMTKTLQQPVGLMVHV
eukprot:5079178-Amphidinium_carterae.1